MKAVYFDGVRGDAHRRANDAAEQQPWRCVKCNTPVRLGRGDSCKCIEHLLKKASKR